VQADGWRRHARAFTLLLAHKIVLVPFAAAVLEVRALLLVDVKVPPDVACVAPSGVRRHVAVHVPH